MLVHFREGRIVDLSFAMLLLFFAYTIEYQMSMHFEYWHNWDIYYSIVTIIKIHIRWGTVGSASTMVYHALSPMMFYECVGTISRDWILLWDAMQFLYSQAFHWHCTCLPGFDSPWQCDRLRWFAFNSRCHTSCVRPAMDCLKVSAYSLLLALVAQWQIDCVCSMLWLFTQCVLNIHVISMINCSSNKGVLWCVVAKVYQMALWVTLPQAYLAAGADQGPLILSELVRGSVEVLDCNSVFDAKALYKLNVQNIYDIVWDI